MCCVFVTALLAGERSYFHRPKDGDPGLRQMLLLRAACGHVRDFGDAVKRNLNPAKDLVDNDKSDSTVQVCFDSIRAGPHRPSRSGKLACSATCSHAPTPALQRYEASSRNALR